MEKRELESSDEAKVMAARGVPVNKKKDQDTTKDKPDATNPATLAERLRKAGC